MQQEGWPHGLPVQVRVHVLRGAPVPREPRVRVRLQEVGPERDRQGQSVDQGGQGGQDLNGDGWSANSWRLRGQVIVLGLEE